MTQIRCGGVFSFITNFSQNAPLKKNWKSVNIWQRYGEKFVAYFLGHLYNAVTVIVPPPIIAVNFVQASTFIIYYRYMVLASSSMKKSLAILQIFISQLSSGTL